MSNKQDLINILNDFDESAQLSASYSEADLEVSSKYAYDGDNLKAEMSMPSKIKNLVKIVSKIANSFSKTFGSSFKINKFITYNASNLSGKIDIVGDKNVSVSINVKKLTRLPALEAYAYIVKSMTKAFAMQNDLTEEQVIEKLEAEEETKKQNEENNKNKDILKAKKILAGYLKKFMQNAYADEFDKFDHISEFISSQIVNEMGEKDLNKILSAFFDFESSGIDVIAERKIDIFLGASYSARLSNVRKKASQIAEDPSKEITVLNYEEQANALLNNYAADPNYKDLAKKFAQINNGQERQLTGPAIKEFCEYYVHNFLHSNNIGNLAVTFENKGELGTYYDGENPSININLTKLERVGSFTELAMTLSHELTHAAEAAQNMKEDKFNRYGGGLINIIDEDVSNSGAEGDALKLLEDLSVWTYYINPHERTARIGELSALLFMQKVGSKDPAIRQEMKTSINGFIKYQKTTKEKLDQLPSQIQAFISKRDALLSSGQITKGSLPYQMIQERITYLQQNGLGKGYEQEDQSIAKAEEILRQLAEEENAKRVESAGVEFGE